MSAEAFTHDVFLSHSAKDKAVVRPLAERLRQGGLKVRFDEWTPSPAGAGEGGRRPGEGRGAVPLAHRMGEGSGVRAAKIEEGLEHSRVLVLCMSANAFGSDWAQLEAGTCGRGNLPFRDPLNQERRFIPLRLDDAPIKGSLAQFLHINWRSADREQRYAQIHDPNGHRDVKLDADAWNRFATWMDTYAQHPGHYGEEQEMELVKLREQLSTLAQ